MARKKAKPAGVPEWMVTFGDMMSLLLCFFIMLFALSIITPPRFQALVDTLSQDFTGYAGSSDQRAKSNKTTRTISDSAAKSRRISAQVGGQPSPGPRGESTEILAISLDGSTVKGGLIRFELGSYELADQAKWQLRRILPDLQGSLQRIMVKGYAAPSEGGREQQNNSDLAFSRAISVVDYLVTLGLNPMFFETCVAPGTFPDRNILPTGTDPKNAGAFAEIILLNQTAR